MLIYKGRQDHAAPVAALFGLWLLFCCSCTPQHRISRAARKILLADSSLSKAHIGISIYRSDYKKPMFDYQGGHYFIPASNTKIATCYAAMKYLGDSLAGIAKVENDTAILIYPTGDPTLLDPAFAYQPVL